MPENAKITMPTDNSKTEAYAAMPEPPRMSTIEERLSWHEVHLAKAQSDLAIAQSELAKATKERGDLAKNIERLEKFAGVRGLSAAGAVPVLPDSTSGETMTRADFEKLSHKARGEFFANRGKLVD